MRAVLTLDLAETSDEEHANRLHHRSGNHDCPSTELVIESQHEQVPHESNRGADERVVEHLDTADLSDDDRSVERAERLAGGLQEEVGPEDNQRPAERDALETLLVPRSGLLLLFKLDGEDDLLQLAFDIVVLLSEEREGSPRLFDAALLDEPAW